MNILAITFLWAWAMTVVLVWFLVRQIKDLSQQLADNKERLKIIEKSEQDLIDQLIEERKRADGLDIQLKTVQNNFRHVEKSEQGLRAQFHERSKRVVDLTVQLGQLEKLQSIAEERHNEDQRLADAVAAVKVLVLVAEALSDVLEIVHIAPVRHDVVVLAIASGEAEQERKDYKTREQKKEYQ